MHLLSSPFKLYAQLLLISFQLNFNQNGNEKETMFWIVTEVFVLVLRPFKQISLK
jgi:hypothetical protein